jgi:hypothetical protein
MIYLASPYTHPDPVVREERFAAACAVAAQLLRFGHLVFSPICHSHPLTRFGLPLDWGFWERCDRQHLERCSELIVLMLPGWTSSRGVLAEIAIARELGLPVRYLEGPATTTPTLAPDATEAGI